MCLEDYFVPMFGHRPYQVPCLSVCKVWKRMLTPRRCLSMVRTYNAIIPTGAIAATDTDIRIYSSTLFSANSATIKGGACL